MFFPCGLEVGQSVSSALKWGRVGQGGGWSWRYDDAKKEGKKGL